MSDFETRARHAADAVRRQIAELPASDEANPARATLPVPGRLRLAVAASILIGAVAIGVPVLRAGISPVGTVPRPAAAAPPAARLTQVGGVWRSR